MKRLKDINNSLPALLLGILVFGFFAEIIPIWFVEDKLGYSVGLLAGVICALFAAWHMAWTLDRTLGDVGKSAEKSAQIGGVLRYGICLLVLMILVFTGIGNPIAAVLGMFGLKVSAYLAPFTNKLFRR